MSDNAVQPTTERALLRRIAVEQREKRSPSMFAAVVRDGGTVWSAGRGRVDGGRPTDDTQYRIGSITKTFVGVALLRLRDEGLLSLSDPFDKHVPGTPLGDRTIAQLLSQSSGVTAEPPGEWWERTPGRAWEDLAADLGPESVPLRAGHRFHYSNLGFGVLGELVARLRGTDWFSVVSAEILEPLGMRRTTLGPQAPHATGLAVHPWADVLLPEPAHDAGAMAPAGQFWSTGADLARWVAFLGGDTGGVLHPDTLAEAREPAIVEDDDVWTGGYGLGIQLLRDRGRRLAGHGGSMPGFLAGVWADPAERTGAVVLCNTTNGPAVGAVVADLIDILAWHEPSVPEEWLPLPDADAALVELAGPWYWGPTPFALRLGGGRWLDLTPLTGTGRRSRFRPAGEDRWIGLDGYYSGERLRIVRRADGSIDHLDLNTFVFTRTPYDREAAVPGGVDPESWRGAP